MSTSFTPRLPVELWSMILRSATELPGSLNTDFRSPLETSFPIHPLLPCAPYAGDPHTELLKTKKSVVRVSRLWNLIASPFLYETVVIQRPLQIKALSRTLHRHAQRIIRLDIESSDAISPALLEPLLRHTTRLRIFCIDEIRSCGPSRSPRRLSAGSWLASIASAQIPTLRCYIDHSTPGSETRMPDLLRLIECSPKLEILDIETPERIDIKRLAVQDYNSQSVVVKFDRLHTLRMSGGIREIAPLPPGAVVQMPNLIHMSLPLCSSAFLSAIPSSNVAESVSSEQIDVPSIRSANDLDSTHIMTHIRELILEEGSFQLHTTAPILSSVETIGFQCYVSCPTLIFNILSNRTTFPKLRTIRVLPKRGYAFEKNRIMRLAGGLGPYLAETMIEEWICWTEKFKELGIALQECDGSPLISDKDIRKQRKRGAACVLACTDWVAAALVEG